MKVIPFSNQAIADALTVLQNGGVVAHATETCYGLACDLSNPDAVTKLFAIKQRPESQPVSALFASVDEAKKYVEWNDRAEELAAQYLPGPLTLILPLRSDSPKKLFPHTQYSILNTLQSASESPPPPSHNSSSPPSPPPFQPPPPISTANQTPTRRKIWSNNSQISRCNRISLSTPAPCPRILRQPLLTSQKMNKHIAKDQSPFKTICYNPKEFFAILLGPLSLLQPLNPPHVLPQM